jgi:Protein of unknown function (DUF2971)
MTSMRVYHFRCETYGLKSIRERRLKISTIDELNDPFEALIFKLPNKSLRRQFEAKKSKFASKHGLLCFSKVWSNALMWSHYADRHRGICLGFDVPKNGLIHVEYNAHRMIDGSGMLRADLPIDDRMIRTCLGTKYASWSYEQEVRRIESFHDKDIDVQGRKYTRFSPELDLVEVIIGPRLWQSRDKIENSLGVLRGSVEIINSRLAFNSFRVVRQNNRRLWN